MGARAGAGRWGRARTVPRAARARPGGAGSCSRGRRAWVSRPHAASGRRGRSAGRVPPCQMPRADRTCPAALPVPASDPRTATVGRRGAPPSATPTLGAANRPCDARGAGGGDTTSVFNWEGKVGCPRGRDLGPARRRRHSVESHLEVPSQSSSTVLPVCAIRMSIAARGTAEPRRVRAPLSEAAIFGNVPSSLSRGRGVGSDFDETERHNSSALLASQPRCHLISSSARTHEAHTRANRHSHRADPRPQTRTLDATFTGSCQKAPTDRIST